jgi:DNA topoisomerase-1
MRFRFLGKSGKPHDVVLSDRRVARIVSQCQELPGQQLLQYLVDDETVRGVDSRDVNDYIREVTRTAFTAKTFRTWGASAYTLGYLRGLGPAETERQANAQVREAVKATAELLRNTATVCRQSYVHPAVPEAHIAGSLHTARKPRARADGLMQEDEQRLLALLDGNSH